MRAVAKGILNWRTGPDCSKWLEEERGFEEEKGKGRGKGKRVVWKV